MLFNSASFFVFLIVSLPVYYAMPPARRKWALLAASYAFYGIWSVPYLTLLLIATSVAYAAGIGIEANGTEAGKRKTLALSLVLLVGALVLFKYAGFLSELLRLAESARGADLFARIVVPLGISYYTFKLISYVMDVYWDKIPAERDFAAFALFPAFFPQILSGPIQRAGDFLPQVKRPILNDPERITSGLRLILFGYFKKVVVADGLAQVTHATFADVGLYSSLAVLLACYAYVFQLYADFSGFTDIAIGVGRLFGVESPKNFNMPFYSPNLQVFWRGWHMTLTRWLADYVFMPLRMAFRARGSMGIAASITVNFVLIGLWHGATWPFLAFGLLHALYMSVSVFTLPKRDAFFERRPVLAKARRLWAPLITFQLWTLSQVLFRADSLTQASDTLTAIAAFDLAKLGVPNLARRVLVGILVMETVHWIQARGHAKRLLESSPIVLRWAVYYAFLLASLTSFGQVAQPFIYFQF